MRGYIHYTEDGSNVEAEIASCPKVRREPMSEERFDRLVHLAEIGLGLATIISCTFMLGFSGLLMSGTFVLFFAVIRLAD